MGRNRRTVIYDKDVGRAAVLAVIHPAAAGRVFNVTDGEFHTLKEIIDSICAALGRRPPKLFHPRFLGPIRGWDIGRWNPTDWAARSAITRSTIHKYTEDIAVSGKRIREELGFSSQYDLETGWKETIQEMREFHVL